MILLLLATTFIPAIITIIFFIRQQRAATQEPKNPPGPKGLPIIGNLHQFNTPSPHLYLYDLSKKYGPLMHMRLGSVPVIIVTSSKIAEQVLKTHDLSFCTRPKFLGPHTVFYDGLDISFGPYGESWRELRKIGSLRLFSSKRVLSFKPDREEVVFGTMDRISDGSGSGRAVDFGSAMMSYSSTLICRIAFGKIFRGEGSEQRRRFDELMIECQAMQGGFFASDYLPLLGGFVDRWSGMIGRLKTVCGELDKFYQEIINEHLDPRRPKPAANELDILDCMIQLKEEKSCSIDLTWNHVKAILSDVFVAGTDTAAATLTWAMTALRAVVKETLRLYPPAPLLLPREALEKCTIQGYTIRPKTVVYINAWAIAREEEYWENPNEFKPERFMDHGNSMDITGRDSFQAIPFGGGRRGCPGITMGLVNVELALANLLYSFDWELPRGVKAEDIDTEVLPGITMHKKNPLHLVPSIYKFN